MPVSRRGPTWQWHQLVEFSKLKVRRGVPRVQFDSFLKMVSGFLAVLRHSRQTPRQERLVLGHLRSDLHALAEPQNRSRKIVRTQALFGSNEAVVHSSLAFGLALAESESACLGKLLVVTRALLLVRKGLVSRRQLAH